MTSAALYSFTDTNEPKNKPLHFLYYSDSARPDAAGVISDLAGVAERVTSLREIVGERRPGRERHIFTSKRERRPWK